MTRDGVYKDNKDKKWIAQAPARLNGGKRVIGRYLTEELAIKARIDWEKKTNFIQSLKDLTVGSIHKYFSYDELTGDILYKVNTSRNSVGDVATFKRKDGYKVLRLGNVNQLAHRVIFLLKEGYLPEEYVDHEDGFPSNNKPENLRKVDSKLNQRNMKKRSDNTSGVTGLHWRKDRNSWEAYLQTDEGKKSKHFKCKEKAKEWLKEMYQINEYHENHGR